MVKTKIRMVYHQVTMKSVHMCAYMRYSVGQYTGILRPVMHHYSTCRLREYFNGYMGKTCT